MVDAQKYLDEKYPKEGRKSIMKLDLACKDLEGGLRFNWISSIP